MDPNDAGTYTCMVRARSGETASRDIRLTVSSEYLWIKMEWFFYEFRRVSKRLNYTTFQFKFIIQYNPKIVYIYINFGEVKIFYFEEINI